MTRPTQRARRAGKPVLWWGVQDKNGELYAAYCRRFMAVERAGAYAFRSPVFGPYKIVRVTIERAEVRAGKGRK
jgi:hypothetical protein